MTKLFCTFFSTKSRTNHISRSLLLKVTDCQKQSRFFGPPCTAGQLPALQSGFRPLHSTETTSHLRLSITLPKTKLQNISSGPKPPDISVDGNTVESVNGFVYLGSKFTIIGWSMSSRPNTPYRPWLCSHDVTKTDMERQAPDTRHQAPYIPDTCCVCVTVRRRHLDLTISISWCEDSGCFSVSLSVCLCRRSSLLTTPIRQSTSRGCLPHVVQPSNSITAICCGLVASDYYCTRLTASFPWQPL